MSNGSNRLARSINEQIIDTQPNDERKFNKKIKKVAL